MRRLHLFAVTVVSQRPKEGSFDVGTSVIVATAEKQARSVGLIRHEMQNPGNSNLRVFTVKAAKEQIAAVTKGGGK